MLHAANDEPVIGSDPFRLPRFRAAYEQLLPEIEHLDVSSSSSSFAHSTSRSSGAAASISVSIRVSRGDDMTSTLRLAQGENQARRPDYAAANGCPRPQHLQVLGGLDARSIRILVAASGAVSELWLCGRAGVGATAAARVVAAKRVVTDRGGRPSSGRRID